MPSITLICTEHNESGACNLNALYRIVERIEPEIIFEELPPSAFENFYVNKTESKLESQTINAYLENYNINHILVDLNEDFKELIDKFGYVYRRIAANSHDFRTLFSLYLECAFRNGFKYLNSDECSSTYVRIYDAMENALYKLNDSKLLKIYNQWNDIIEKRENEMINNIYRYSRNHHYNRGLFFIGAAHRKSIIEKILKRSKEIEINWNYQNYDGIL